MGALNLYPRLRSGSFAPKGVPKQELGNESSWADAATQDENRLGSVFGEPEGFQANSRGLRLCDTPGKTEEAADPERVVETR